MTDVVAEIKQTRAVALQVEIWLWEGVNAGNKKAIWVDGYKTSNWRLTYAPSYLSLNYLGASIRSMVTLPTPFWVIPNWLAAA